MRWVDHRKLIVVFAIARLHCPGFAQSLDLAVPEPAPGASLTHRTIADDLKQAAATMRMTSEDRENSAPAAIRELASALIERGLRRTNDGAELLIAGRTIAGHLAMLDAALEALDKVDRMTIAADCRRLAATLTGEPEEMDRALRNALAPLTGSVTPDPNAGWLGRNAPAPDSARLTAQVDRSPVRSAPGLLRLLDEARTDQAYRPSADRLARRLQAASAVLDLPKWVPDDARDALGNRFAQAVYQSLGGNAITAAGDLDALAQLAALMQVLGVFPLDADLELARAHAGAIAVDSAPIPVARISLALQLAREAKPIELDPIPKSFVRDLRPAWAYLVEQSERRRSALLPYLAPALRSTRDSDPGLLAALNSARRTRKRLADLPSLNAWLKAGLAEDSPGVAHRDHRLLADRASRLLRDSPASLWNLADQSRRFALLPAENLWRDPKALNAGWIQSIDPLVADLAPAADRLREQWENEWIQGKVGTNDGTMGSSGADAAQELEAGIRLLNILDAIGDAQEADRSGWRLNSWPGWEHPVSTPLGPALVGDAAPLAVLVAAWTDPLTRVDENDLAEAEQRYAAVCAVARLEKRLKDAGRTPASPSLAGVLAQLGLGSPDPTTDPLTIHRSDIAELNRRVLEAIALANDNKRATQSLEYANAQAQRLLMRLE